MKINSIEDPIAVRKLNTSDDKSILVTIGKPVPFEDENDFYCPYCIESDGMCKFSYAGGVDAVQSLQLAMKKIGVDLEYLMRKEQIQITWLPDTPGDIGFPL